MTGKHLSQPVLSVEQQAEAELIYERIRGAFDEEARRLAELMASKETRHIFGETEYQIRDRVHALGAEGLAAAAEERGEKRGLWGGERRVPALSRGCPVRGPAGEADCQAAWGGAAAAGGLSLPVVWP